MDSLDMTCRSWHDGYMNEIQCSICRETIISQYGESYCYSCIDKLLRAAVALQKCSDYSRENPRVLLTENPHYKESIETHAAIRDFQWGCLACGSVLCALTDAGDWVATACCMKEPVHFPE